MYQATKQPMSRTTKFIIVAIIAAVSMKAIALPGLESISNSLDSANAKEAIAYDLIQGLPSNKNR